MMKIILLNILFSLLILDTPMNPQDIYALNKRFDNIPQYPINNTDAKLYFIYKYSGNSVKNTLVDEQAEKRAEELNEEINNGKYFYLSFTAQLQCTGYNIEENTFKRVVWKNIVKNWKKNLFEIKSSDNETQQELNENYNSACSSLYLNMAGIIGMYNELLFPTYASEKIKEEFLNQNWINFKVEILFNTFDGATPSVTANTKYSNPDCALIVPYAIRIQHEDCLAVYIFE